MWATSVNTAIREADHCDAETRIATSSATQGDQEHPSICSSYSAGAPGNRSALIHCSQDGGSGWDGQTTSINLNALQTAAVPMVMALWLELVVCFIPLAENRSYG